MKLYHNPRCGKSRQALALLEGKYLEIIFYLKDVPSVKELEDICSKCDVEPVELLRKNEAEYKELKNKHGEPSNEQSLDWMHEHPKLIERPILINGSKGVVGRPPENVLKIL